MESGATSFEVRVLGPVGLRIDGRDVAVGGPRQRALLALLALRPGQVAPADELVEELWAGEPTDGAEATLRSYVSRLRASLGGSAPVRRTDRGYVLEVPASAVDALEFERLIREGGELLARGAARRARERLTAALALWRGRAFGEVGSEGTLAAAGERLEELRHLAIERRIEAELALGRGADLVDELESLVREQPFRERLWHHLMLALYRAGRQADALAAYHRARSALDEHLGIEPGPELRELEGAILRQDVPAPPMGADAGGNLPAPMTSFVGRSRELAEVRGLVSANRLVTLSGVGGVGKTRLALEVARQVVEAFEDGAWFVDQAPLTHPELVASNTASVLGMSLPASTTPLDGLLSLVGDRELLLVLDNCEHLRDACAELAAALLTRAPGVHIIATSRVTLGIPGEVDYAVPPLAVATAGRDAGTGASDAADLFMERARAARPGLSDDGDSRATVERIVADLDGLPLAIELAAARAKALTVTDIASGLDDRFRFLVSWRRLSAARHRTLAEAMAWSFDLLEPDAQEALAQLSVFAGSFDLAAVAAVSFDGDQARALEVVQRLVDASLVMLEPAPDGRSRYRLLETVRQYAAERLAASGRTEATRAAHAGFYAALAETTPTRGAEAPRGMSRLDQELDNLRAAIDSALELGDERLHRRLTAALWRYWQVRGLLTEGRARLAAALEGGPGASADLYAAVLDGAASTAWAIGEYAEGKRYARELLAIGEASGSTALAHAGHKTLANIALRERDFETSNEHSLRTVALAREIGDAISLRTAELNHAVLLMDWGRVEQAIPMLEDALAGFRELGHDVGIGLSLLNLGEAAFLLGDDAGARTRFEAARSAFVAVGFRAHVAHATQGLAAVEARSGDPAVAADLLGRAAAILTEVGAAPDDFNPGIVAGASEAAKASLGEAGYGAAFDAGRASERSRR